MKSITQIKENTKINRKKSEGKQSKEEDTKECVKSQTPTPKTFRRQFEWKPCPSLTGSIQDAALHDGNNTKSIYAWRGEPKSHGSWSPRGFVRCSLITYFLTLQCGAYGFGWACLACPFYLGLFGCRPIISD